MKSTTQKWKVSETSTKQIFFLIQMFRPCKPHVYTTISISMFKSLLSDMFYSLWHWREYNWRWKYIWKTTFGGILCLLMNEEVSGKLASALSRRKSKIWRAFLNAFADHWKRCGVVRRPVIFHTCFMGNNTVHLTKKLSGRFCLCVGTLFCHFLSSTNSFVYIKFYEMLHMCNTCHWRTNVSNLYFYKTCCKTVQQSLNIVKHTNIAWEELVLWEKKP